MACDWMVIRQLPEAWQDANQLIVAGSFALHEAMVRRGLAPAWYPNDIDVWCVNGTTLQELARFVTERLRALGLVVEATPGCGDYVTEDRFGHCPSHQDCNQDAINKLDRGSCVVMRVIDFRYSFDGVVLGKLSLIGTRPAYPRGRYAARPPPPLTAAKVMGRFDIDVCRVGLRLPQEDLVFVDANAFDRALQTMTAVQTKKVEPSEQEVLKEAKRRRLYESRGFKF